MTTYLIFVCSIGFLDPQNIDLDSKINVIGQLEAELWKLTSFLAAILNFLGETTRVASWCCNFWNQHLSKLRFMLFSQSAHPVHISAPLTLGHYIKLSGLQPCSSKAFGYPVMDE